MDEEISDKFQEIIDKCPHEVTERVNKHLDMLQHIDKVFNKIYPEAKDTFINESDEGIFERGFFEGFKYAQNTTHLVYTVEVCEGLSFDESWYTLATFLNKEKAEAYRDKFNTILYKWQEYFKQYVDPAKDWLQEDIYYSDSWISNKWIKIKDIHQAFIIELKVRT